MYVLTSLTLQKVVIIYRVDFHYYGQLAQVQLMVRPHSLVIASLPRDNNCPNIYTNNQPRRPRPIYMSSI